MTGGRHPNHRIELRLGLDHPNRHIPGILADPADSPRRHRTWLDEGRTIPGDEPAWGETERSDFLFVGGDQFLESLDLSEGVHIGFLIAIPIFRPELEYKKGHGRRALLQAWDVATVSYADPHRRPTSLPPPPRRRPNREP
jgi:hypothetical protein